MATYSFRTLNRLESIHWAASMEKYKKVAVNTLSPVGTATVEYVLDSNGHIRTQYTLDSEPVELHDLRGYMLAINVDSGPLSMIGEFDPISEDVLAMDIWNGDLKTISFDDTRPLLSVIDGQHPWLVLNDDDLNISDDDQDTSKD